MKQLILPLNMEERSAQPSDFMPKTVISQPIAD